MKTPPSEMAGWNRFCCDRIKCSDIIPNQHSCEFALTSCHYTLKMCAYACCRDGPGAKNDADRKEAIIKHVNYVNTF